MGLSSIGMMIHSLAYEEAQKSVEAMHEMGVLPTDSAKAILDRLSEWGFVLVVASVTTPELSESGQRDPEMFSEVYRLREEDFRTVKDAFLTMDPEKLKPLACPIPEKYQIIVQKTRAFAERKNEESKRRILPVVAGLRAAFPDIPLPMAEGPHDCEKCPEDLRRLCPFPEAQAWREKNPA